MRRVDVDEESYFNGDDEEDEDEGVAPGPHPAPLPTLPLISPPLSRYQSAAARRNRQHTPVIPLRTGLGSATQRASTPSAPIHLPRTPPINALVEYGDDDEQSSDPEDVLLESLVSPKPPPSAGTFPTPTNPSTTVPTTTTITTAAATTTTTAGTGPGVGSGGFVPLRAEKRRRAEEDEDEMGLERLIGSKTRRSTKTGTGAGEEAPKRIRLRFGAASLAAASSTLPTAARSESGAKDGDTG